MPKNVNITFGRELKRLRLEAKIGLRKFATLIEMAPSNLSNIERGKIAPPASRSKIDLICNALGLGPKDKERDLLFDLSAQWDKHRLPADVSASIKRQPGIPVLVRTVTNKQLSERKLRDLAKYIEQYY